MCNPYTLTAGEDEKLEKPPFISKENSQKYLQETCIDYFGIGYRVNQMPVSTIVSLLEDVKKLHDSLLAPWQKIEALRSYSEVSILSWEEPRWPWNPADNKIKAYVKKWLRLP